MKSHYTLKELAGLAGMPVTRRAVLYMAERENWQFQKRLGKGGGREYAFDSLPAETRESLKRLLLPVEIPPATPARDLIVAAATIQPATTTAQLKQWQRDVMNARVEIVRIVERAAVSVGVKAAITRIVQDSVDNDLPLYAVARARSGQEHCLSYRGVIRWWSLWKKTNGEPLALAPKDVEDYCEPLWGEAFMKFWCKGQNPCLTDVLEQYYSATGEKVPTYWQARNYLEKLGKVQSSKGRKTGTEMRALKPFRRRDTSQMFPGDAYTADGHCFDSEIYHPFTGRSFRPEVTPVLDVYSRKCVGWSVDLAESGLAVLDALRMACETNGIPSIFYTDNGSGFKNQMMTNAGTGLLTRLGITPKYSRPRNPQGHGLSERGHQTILIKAAQQLCTYIGSKMDGDTARLVFKETRKAMDTGEKSALMPEFDDFVNIIQRAVEKYNNTPHRGLPALRDPISKKRIHQTPNQAWLLGIERMKRELPEIEWLVASGDQVDLYHPAVERTCGRGEVQLGTLSNGSPRKYFSKDLEHWTGTRVSVAYSPSDPRKVWVRDLEHQRLLAVAELSGNSSEYFVESELEKARGKRGKAALKRLENHVEEKRLEMYGAKPIPVAYDPEVKREVLKIVKRLEQEEEEASVFELPAGERDRQDLWGKLDKRLQQGEELTQEESNFYRGWQKSEYFRFWDEMNNEKRGDTESPQTTKN